MNFIKKTGRMLRNEKSVYGASLLIQCHCDTLEYEKSGSVCHRCGGDFCNGGIGVGTFSALMAHAAVSSWQQGATMVPKSQTDFGSDSFKQSLRNLKATGANYVSFVVPYYQSNMYSTDIQNGWNTPTDASLKAAIDYAHELGLAVMLKPHVESYGGEWRAYINPSDRNEWFGAYGAKLLNLGEIGRVHHVEMISIGTEMVSMTVPQINSTNTQNWINLIGQLRAVYNGKLTYGANSTNNDNSYYQNEKKFIGFWSYLDYAGLSVYYGLNSDSSVDGMKGAWNYWNNNDIKGFAQSVGKQVLFLEIGYRSLQDAHRDPWNWQRGGASDETLQANAYEALLSYWNDYDYLAGVYWWDWETNPNAGGQGNSDYTPQRKAAELVLTRWYTAAPQPTQPPSTPSFSSSASANPGGPNVGTATSVRASIKNLTMSPTSGGIVDIEIYNASNQRVYQQFYENQAFGSGEERNFDILWTPTAAGEYRVTVGVFSGGWSTAYHWNNSALTFSVGQGSANPPPPPPPPTGSATTNIWWPTDGASLQGVQPLKAMLEGRDVSQYQMFWSVDGGVRNSMFNSSQDYPHKEALVDFTGWNWKGSGPYTLTFISTNSGGAVISQKSVNVFVR
jgi:hypothetical protein